MIACLVTKELFSAGLKIALTRNDVTTKKPWVIGGRSFFVERT
jgi:hypothetical protein